ncbi:MAG TPA: S1/P1 nuclease [Gammaproteobacteria bacterium]
MSMDGRVDLARASARAVKTLALALVASAGAAALAGPALAFGPEGHRVAGRLAEPLLCPAAAAAVESLAGGEDLGEIGVWADRIRDDEAWRHTGPWHYMNIADGASIASFVHPPEGDVLWAIERHAARLAAPGSRADKREALRFLVHFVVDVHQPLHVGRESDRGGNTIDVRVGGETITLHRFWDTDVLRLAGLPEPIYARGLEPLVRLFVVAAGDDPYPTWAAESLALRPQVYAFTAARSGAVRLDDAYLDRADAITRVRLAQAAARLAATLNRILAPGEAC